MFFFNIVFIAVIFVLNISKNKTVITYFLSFTCNMFRSFRVSIFTIDVN
jgi:hypothetical protein